VGCGPGTLTADLARLVAPGEVIGVDVSAEVVAEAIAFAADAGVRNVRFLADDFRVDRANADQLHALLAEVAAQGPAVLVATHNERLAGLAGTVLILDAGRTYRRGEPA
jgi:tRNA G46 methylase TrmB